MNFQELTDAYSRNVDEFLLQVELKCAKRREKAITPTLSPSFVKDVIIPIYESLAEIMHRKGVKTPNPQTYLPIKGYYRIRIGVTTVGGFSVPDGGDYNIYFTPMKSAKPIGDRQLVNNTEELKQLIINQLNSKKVGTLK